MRQARITRNTSETRISAAVNLDGSGASAIDTGIGFLDHMMAQLARHGLMDLNLKAKGDLHIDYHHTVEDCGYAVGAAVDKALGDRSGIRRFGDALTPMDECLSRVALDLSGRSYLVWRVEFSQPKLGDFDTELFREWFLAFSRAAGANLHVEILYGLNNHHMIESCYKGLARALCSAVTQDARREKIIPSTKGALIKARA